MVMYKKGYLRTIEAILAILLVFGFLLTVLPKGNKDDVEGYRVPVALELTSVALLEEIQTNDVFRTCVLNDDASFVIDPEDISATGITLYELDDQGGVNSVECIFSFLKASFPVYSSWQYAFSLCDVDGTCYYYPALYDADADGSIESGEYVTGLEQLLPAEVNVYPRSLFLSVPDPVSSPLSTSSDATDFSEGDPAPAEEAFENAADVAQETAPAFDEQLATTGNPVGLAIENRILRIYFWEA